MSLEKIFLFFSFLWISSFSSATVNLIPAIMFEFLWLLSAVLTLHLYLWIQFSLSSSENYNFSCRFYGAWCIHVCEFVKQYKNKKPAEQSDYHLGLNINVEHKNINKVRETWNSPEEAKKINLFSPLNFSNFFVFFVPAAS